MRDRVDHHKGSAGVGGQGTVQIERLQNATWKAAAAADKVDIQHVRPGQQANGQFSAIECVVLARGEADSRIVEDTHKRHQPDRNSRTEQITGLNIGRDDVGMSRAGTE